MKKLFKKTTYTSANCLQVFGFYILILLFMSTASSKLNFKHRAQMQKYPSGNLGDALLLATDLIYNSYKKPPKVTKICWSLAEIFHRDNLKSFNCVFHKLFVNVNNPLLSGFVLISIIRWSNKGCFGYLFFPWGGSLKHIIAASSIHVCPTYAQMHNAQLPMTNYECNLYGIRYIFWFNFVVRLSHFPITKGNGKYN